MKCHNSCFVVGYLGADPIERGNAEVGAVVKFTLAENVTKYDRETESYETVHTNWFQVTAFGKIAERAKNALKKGARVAVHGRMKVTRFTDRAGVEKNGFEILADDVALWRSLPSHLGEETGTNESCTDSSDERSNQPVSRHGSAAGRPRGSSGANPRGSQKLGA